MLDFLFMEELFTEQENKIKKKWYNVKKILIKANITYILEQEIISFVFTWKRK